MFVPLFCYWFRFLMFTWLFALKLSSKICDNICNPLGGWKKSEHGDWNIRSTHKQLAKQGTLPGHRGQP